MIYYFLHIIINESRNLYTYELKEKYIIFNATSSYEEAKQNFDGIYNDFVEANVPEYSEFVATLVYSN